jgi:hypothetical protein
VIDSAPMRHLRIRAAALAAASVVALAGCGGGGAGGGSDRESATAAAQTYVDAANARHFDRVCELLSESYKRQLKVGSDCPGFFNEQTSGASRTLTLVGVQVKGGIATAHIQSRARDQSTLIGDETALFVQDQDGRWRLNEVTAYYRK